MRLKFLNVCCRHADFPAPHAPGPALFPVPARVPHRVCLDCHGEGSPGQRVPGGAARDTQDSPEASWLPRVGGRVSMEGLGRACRKGMYLGRTHCGGRGGCAGQSWGFQWFFFFLSVYANTGIDLGQSFLGDLSPCDVGRFASVPTFTLKMSHVSWHDSINTSHGFPLPLPSLRALSPAVSLFLPGSTCTVPRRRTLIVNNWME